MIKALVVGLSLTLSPSVGWAQNTQDAPIPKVVKDCVNAVHRTKLGPDDAYMASFYRNFDAFYNAASQSVENNARTVGDQKALFIFNKCMAERGFPLTYGPTNGK